MDTKWWKQCLVLEAVVGSQSYGLNTTSSDVDVRGVVVLPSRMDWSLTSHQEYFPDGENGAWELKHFMSLGASANPNVLETLYSDKVLLLEEEGRLLRDNRNLFLSNKLRASYLGYANSQRLRFEKSVKNNEVANWKPLMHTLRLLMAAKNAFLNGELLVNVGEQRNFLLDVRAGKYSWEEFLAFQHNLEQEVYAAYEHSVLPDNPDFDKLNDLYYNLREMQYNKEKKG